MGKFYQVLMDLRKKSKLTQSQLAERIGISRSAIGNYENGIREPDFETLEKIADFFNVDMNYLLGESLSEKELYERYHVYSLTSELEQDIINMFRQLNTEGQRRVQAYMEDLISLKKYTEPSAEACESNFA